MKPHNPAVKSFTEIYNANAQHVFKICLGYTNETQQAQDLMQEVFIRVWQKLEQYRGDAKLSTWIYRITVNTCLSHIRFTKNKTSVALEESFDSADDTTSALKEQQVQNLYNAIHKLPETDRLIISMVLEEISYTEIADTLNISEGNLRVKIHRIKQELNKHMIQHG